MTEDRAPFDSDMPTVSANTAGAQPSGAGFAGPRQIADYALLREIGHGGMGTVFEAHDQKMDRRVALKVLSRHFASSESADRRFEREAWIAGKLDHPGLVKVYERGTWQELSYYSMELLDGGSLHDVISNMKRWGRDERLALVFGSREYVNWAMARVIDAARALDYAHRHGVVHRDIKPMNLLLSRELGQVKIADFGLAIDADVTRLTTAGTLLGTLPFMAPEQMLGRQAEIAPPTDVYALGVTLFELLTLELPFVGETQQLYMNAALTLEPRRPSKLNERVGRDLEIVIRKALEKSPGDRYPTAEAFAADLENVLHFRPIAARPPSAPGRAWRWARRRPSHAALLVVLVTGLPILGLLSVRAVQHAALERQSDVTALWDEVRWRALEQADDQVLAGTAEILRLDPSHVLARRARAVTYRRIASKTEGDSAEQHRLLAAALAEIAELEQRAPSAAWPFSLKALLLRDFKFREQEAVQAEQQAARLRQDPPAEDDLRYDAVMARERGDHERAVELFTVLLARRPNAPDEITARAESFLALGDIERATEDLRVAAALVPNEAYTRFQLWRVLRMRGREEEAERYLSEAVALPRQAALVHQAAADAYLQWGRQALSAGDAGAARRDMEQAEQHARRSLDLEPELVRTHGILGASLMERNRSLDAPDRALIQEATGHYQRALEIWRSSPTEGNRQVFAHALIDTCDAEIQLGNLDRALSVCLEVTRTVPDEAAGFYNLAGVYALLGRTGDAFEALERDFALGDRDWQYLAADRWFESLRTDPLFERLQARMKSS